VKIRFTRRALREFDAILTDIGEASPAGALSVRRRIRDVVELLERHPHAGQPMRRRGLRRLVITPYPYLLFYRTTSHEIVILSLRHAARRSSPLLS
jgi:plasmid stabilization system protein ParE